MALTEDEKRSLREIEQGLLAGSPRLQSRSQPTRRGGRTARRVGWIIGEVVAGLALLLLGLLLHSDVGVALGVVGFLAIVAGGWSATPLVRWPRPSDQAEARTHR